MDWFGSGCGVCGVCWGGFIVLIVGFGIFGVDCGLWGVGGCLWRD